MVTGILHRGRPAVKPEFGRLREVADEYFPGPFARQLNRHLRKAIRRMRPLAAGGNRTEQGVKSSNGLSSNSPGYWRVRDLYCQSTDANDGLDEKTHSRVAARCGDCDARSGERGTPNFISAQTTHTGDWHWSRPMDISSFDPGRCWTMMTCDNSSVLSKIPIRGIEDDAMY
jgi:hypothetical protein